MDPRQEAKASPKPPLATPIGTAEPNNDDKGVEHSIFPQPIRKGEPNTMHYTDSNGVSHSITPQPIRPSEPNKIFYTDSQKVEHSIDLPPIIQSAQCNEMSYTDDKAGVERRIYLPQGTMHTAWEHLENERWEELAKFEAYTDQGYSEGDFKTYERVTNKDKSGGGGGGN